MFQCCLMSVDLLNRLFANLPIVYSLLLMTDEFGSFAAHSDKFIILNSQFLIILLTAYCL